MIRIAEYFDPTYNPYWTLLRQVGVDAAVSKLDRGADGEWNDSGDRPWDLAPLAAMQRRYEEEGLELVGIEDYPPMDRLKVGAPGAEEELEAFCTLIRNMGVLGVPMLCYSWMACINWVRTDIARPSRGGARVTAYRAADDRAADAPTWAGVVPQERLWETWERFMERVAPVAEKAGVRLALHPDDPPVPEVRGIGRIFGTVEGFERAMAHVESEANAICLCQGNFTLFADDLPEAIRRFGAEGRIAFGHFRDVAGHRYDFEETFHDQGKSDKVACMRAWHSFPFDGVIRPDHVPTMHGESNDDPAYAWLGRLHAVGYIQGLRAAAEADQGA